MNVSLTSLISLSLKYTGLSVSCSPYYTAFKFKYSTESPLQISVNGTKSKMSQVQVDLKQIDV